MDQIEMLWKCNICKTINGGLSKTCSGCGKALDTEEWYLPDDISEKARLHKPEDLDKALRGPDWCCPSCHSSQRRGDGQCANCGDQETETRRPTTQNQRSQSKKPIAQVSEIDPEEFLRPPFYKQPVTWIIAGIVL